MIKVFIPEIKGKIKTNVRGLWLNDKGKLFYDYLREDIILPIHYKDTKSFNGYLEQIKRIHKQEAVFYIDSQLSCGIVWYNKDKKEVLSQAVESRYYLWHKGKGLKALIKDYLKCYGGVTLYITEDYIDLQAFYNPKES